jgi:glycosyltransferase involved in cell wall biosynthesis
MFVVTEDWYFWSHRLDLARAARDMGYQVLVATRINEYRERLEQEGFVLCPLKWERGGVNPVREAKAFLALVGLYRRQRPTLVCHVALKPILYGAWAARVASVPGVVDQVAGLGWAGSVDSWPGAFLHVILLRMLKWTLALSNSYATFQNHEDARELSDATTREAARAEVIHGSGVDTARFLPSREPAGMPVIMLASRMLWPKGIGDFVAAARLLTSQGITARFVLVGMIDPENPSHIPESQLREWQAEHVIEWWGYREDMPDVLASAHVIVLPTYYGEGLPKVLLEAAACGRPIIATSIRGCAEIVRDGDNGLLIPPRDPAALAEAITKLIEQPELRARMGARGREIVLERFSSQRIVGEYLGVFRRACETSMPAHAAPRGNNDRIGRSTEPFMES